MTAVGEDGMSDEREEGVTKDGVTKDGTVTVDGVIAEGDDVIGECAVGVMDEGDSVAMSNGDSLIVEGVPGEVGH